MTAYQISENDLKGFKRDGYSAGMRARENYRRYTAEADGKKMTAAEKLARIERLPRTVGLRRLGGNKSPMERCKDVFCSAFGVCENTEIVRGRFPVASVLSTFLFAFVLVAVVYSSVRLSGANRNYNEVREQLSASNTEITELNSTLDGRVDLAELQQLAVNEYGMIRKDKAASAFLSVSAGDSVTIGSGTEKDSGDLSLISAFAERIRSLWNNTDSAE